MTIFVDGSCRGNPGRGGFGAVAIDEKTYRVISCYSKQYDYTTNNEMELMACLYALTTFGKQEKDDDWFQPITVYCDSRYAVETLTNWKNKWKSNGWKRTATQPPENLEIIQKYDNLEEKGYKIELRKINGHSGILGNEIADALATGKMTGEEVMQKYG